MSDTVVWGYPGDPKPLSWAEFYRSWSCACVDAWEAGKQEPTVTLPLNVFPGLISMENPITGSHISITRISPFSWDTSRCQCSTDREVCGFVRANYMPESD